MGSCLRKWEPGVAAFQLPGRKRYKEQARVTFRPSDAKRALMFRGVRLVKSRVVSPTSEGIVLTSDRGKK